MPKSLRPRFSLLTLLLLTTIAGLSFAVWRLGSEVVPLREEVRELRAETGQLSIADESKVHAIAIDGNSHEKNWKWRVYLPEGHEYILRAVRVSIPEIGYPEHGRSEISSSISSGEYVIQAIISRNEKGQWMAYLKQLAIPGENVPKVTTQVITSFNLVQSRSNWLDNYHGGSTGGLQEKKQLTQEPNKPLLLIKFRPGVFEPQYPDSDDPIYENVGTTHPAKGPCEGLMVWIEEKQQGMTER